MVLLERISHYQAIEIRNILVGNASLPCISSNTQMEFTYQAPYTDHVIYRIFLKGPFRISARIVTFIPFPLTALGVTYFRKQRFVGWVVIHPTRENTG